MDNKKIREEFRKSAEARLEKLDFLEIFKKNIKDDKKDFILFCSLLMREWGIFNLDVAGPLTIKFRKLFTFSLDRFIGEAFYSEKPLKALFQEERLYIYYSTGKQFVSDYKNLRVRGLDPEELEMEVSNALRRLGSKFASQEGGMGWLKAILLDPIFRSGVKDGEYDPDMMEKLEFIHDLTKGYKL